MTCCNLGLERAQVFRTPEYSARLVDILAAGKRPYRAAIAMERDLIDADGYPSDSHSVAQTLRQIDDHEWQSLLAAFDYISPKGAFLALTYIEQQRIMQRGQLAISYCPLTLKGARRLILLDLHYSPAPMWGHVIKRIYQMTRSGR